MRNTSVLLVILLSFFLCFVACHKDKKENHNGLDNLNGTWTLIGSAGLSYNNHPPDAFMQMLVSVINDTAIVLGDHDTLPLQASSSNERISTFLHDWTYNSWKINYTKLVYDKVDCCVTFEIVNTYSSGGAYLGVYSSAYTPNTSLNKYTTKIAGTRKLAGVCYDTFFSYVHYAMIDSTYSVDTSITFTAVNDSTIAIDKDILGIGDLVLHYKSTDYVANTVTFQTFHSYYYTITTLTYNYVTGSLKLEQQRSSLGDGKYLKLE